MSMTLSTGPTANESPSHKPRTWTAWLDEPAESAGSCLVEDGLRLSRSDIAARSRALATGFARLGVGKGDRVALWMPNRVAWVLGFMACARLGAIAVSVNTRFRSFEVADLLQRSGSKLLVYWPGFKGIDFDAMLRECPPPALEALQHLVAYGCDRTRIADSVHGKAAAHFDDLLEEPGHDGNAVQADTPCIIFTTSGTTRAPKLVVHTHASLLDHAREVASQHGLGVEDRVLVVPPLCGVFGFCSMAAALVAGSTVLLLESWDAGKAAELIEQHGVTHFAASNDALDQLLATRSTEKLFPSIKFAMVAQFNPAHADIALRAAGRDLRVLGVYGSSELQALFSLRDKGTAPKEAGRAGGMPASPSARVRARDPQTHAECALGAAGELEILAPASRFLEYFHDAAATEQAFTADGYFRTGDLGCIDSAGSFTYFARMGDTMRLGGFLVSPAEIEALLQEHSAVESSQVVGVELHGTLKAIAFVVARAGAAIDEGDILGFASGRLAGYKVPARVFSVDSFPVTAGANGVKVQKGKLRDMANQMLRLATARTDGPGTSR